MNNVIARMYDFFDYLFNCDVIKEQSEEDKQYEQLLKEKEQLENDLEIMTKSRDRYLETCKKRTSEIKELKKKIKELKNGKGSV